LNVFIFINNIFSFFWSVKPSEFLTHFLVLMIFQLFLCLLNWLAGFFHTFANILHHYTICTLNADKEIFLSVAVNISLSTGWFVLFEASRYGFMAILNTLNQLFLIFKLIDRHRHCCKNDDKQKCF
jgi:hypothetical protein